MHIWDYIQIILCVVFGVNDQQQQFVTFQFQIAQLFSATEVDSSHIIVQIECTFSWKLSKMGLCKEDFSFLTRRHYLETDPDPIATVIRVELFTHKPSETNTNWHCMVTHARLCYRWLLSTGLVDE